MRALFLCLFALLFARAAGAVPPPAAAVQAVSSYLDSLRTMQAHFIQRDEAGLIESGLFVMQRPSKARWEYYPPSPLTLIANGRILAVIDRELDEVRHVPIESGLSGVLVKDASALFSDKGDVALADYRETEDRYFFTFRKRQAPEDGALTLIFSRPEIALLGFTQLDPAGRTTHIAFDSVKANLPVNRKLFFLPDTSRRGKR